MAASGRDWRNSLFAIVCSVMPAGYPTVRPYKILDFANNQSIDSDFVFTRSTTASFANASGFLEVASANVLRPAYTPATGAYLGALMEFASTNLLPWSNNIAHPSWYYAPQNAPLQSGFIGVGNQATAFRVGEGTVPGVWELGTSISLPSGLTTSYSAFVKADGVSRGYLQFVGLNPSGNVVGNLLVNFDLAKGEVYPENLSSNSLFATSIEPWRNGWYRIGGVGSISSVATLGVLYLRLKDDNNSTFYLGRGNGLLVDGFQVERATTSVGSNLISSFIATSGTALSRATDLLASEGARINNWYTQGSQTFYVEAITDYKDYNGVGRGHVLVTNTGTSERADIRFVCVAPGGSYPVFQASLASGAPLTTFVQVPMVNGLNAWENPSSGAGTTRPITAHCALSYTTSGAFFAYNGAISNLPLGLVPSGINRVEIAAIAGGKFIARRYAFYPYLTSGEASLVTQS